MKPWETRGFVELQKHWYSKLKHSGFKDIEKNEQELVAPAPVIPMDIEDVATYYRMTRWYLENGEFRTLLHKVIWFVHSEGLHGSEVTKVVRASESTVSRVISEYEKKMIAK